MALDREYDANRAWAVARLELLREDPAEPRPSEARSIQLRNSRTTFVLPTPMSAVETGVPLMEDGFTFRDLLTSIQSKYPDFKKEPVRSAFRAFANRPNSPIEQLVKEGPTAPNRYKRRVDHGPHLRGMSFLNRLAGKDLSVVNGKEKGGVT